MSAVLDDLREALLHPAKARAVPLYVPDDVMEKARQAAPAVALDIIMRGAVPTCPMICDGEVA